MEIEEISKSKSMIVTICGGIRKLDADRITDTILDDSVGVSPVVEPFVFKPKVAAAPRIGGSSHEPDCAMANVVLADLNSYDAECVILVDHV